MTQKDKAKELIVNFSDVGLITSIEAKQCALIAVDEILKSVPKQPSRSITMPHFEATVYWEEVKNEIEKL